MGSKIPFRSKGHGRRRPGVGPRAAGRCDHEFRRRRGGAGFHFLVFEKKALRVVFRTGYEYGFGRAHGAVGRPKRRSAYRYPLALIARLEAAVSSLMFCPMNDLTTFRGIMHL